MGCARCTMGVNRNERKENCGEFFFASGFLLRLPFQPIIWGHTFQFLFSPPVKEEERNDAEGKAQESFISD